MQIHFYKYQGAGNDFIMLDNFDKKYDNVLKKEQIADLCHRRFGVGADGLISLEKHEDYDFSMRYFNSDGGEAEMCGNGGRCIVAFAYRQKRITKEHVRFLALDGVHEAIIEDNGDWIKLLMGNVEELETNKNFYFLNTGVPHVVKFVDKADKIDIITEGRKIRNSKRFIEIGTNVNFVELKVDELYVRTYERGVENETLACGTGVTAAAIAAYVKYGYKRKEFLIRVKGGKMGVSFNTLDNQKFTNIWLQGPAQSVFKGEIKI